MCELKNPEFQLEVIEMLKPKIKSVLTQTDFQHRGDLEQELLLMVVTAVQTKKFKKVPSFFELIESEKSSAII